MTETDKRCEELVLGTIHGKFPDHKFIGEEGSAAQASSDQLTILVSHPLCMSVTLMASPDCQSNAEDFLQALSRLISLQGFTDELTSEPTWMCDPVDGTTNFVHSFPFVCVCIGLAVEKQVKLASCT